MCEDKTVVWDVVGKFGGCILVDFGQRKMAGFPPVLLLDCFAQLPVALIAH